MWSERHGQDHQVNEGVCVCVCACVRVCVRVRACVCVCMLHTYIHMYMQTQQCTNIGWYLVVGENDLFIDLPDVNRSYWIQSEGLVGA